jgi:heme-degrading monooxygenase HmoA
VFVTMVIHHPKPFHQDDFLDYMYRVTTEMQGTPGLISIESLRDVDADRLVAIGRWESPEAAAAGIPRLMAIGGRDPDWTTEPDQIFRLVL